MKIAIAAAFVGVVVFNTTTALKVGERTELKLSGVEAVSQMEITLPEVVITCTAPGSSSYVFLCWDQDCIPEYTPFGPIKVTYCSEFTGYTWMSCIPDMPCF